MFLTRKKKLFLKGAKNLGFQEPRVWDIRSLQYTPPILVLIYNYLAGVGLRKLSIVCYTKDALPSVERSTTKNAHGQMGYTLANSPKKMSNDVLHQQMTMG